MKPKKVIGRITLNNFLIAKTRISKFYHRNKIYFFENYHKVLTCLLQLVVCQHIIKITFINKNCSSGPF